MADDDRHLSPEQTRAIGRVQLVGVLLLIGLIVSVRIVGDATTIATWQILTVCFVAMLGVAAIGTMAVARIERLPARDITLRTLRDIRTDLTGRIARLHRRGGG